MDNPPNRAAFAKTKSFTGLAAWHGMLGFLAFLSCLLQAAIAQDITGFLCYALGLISTGMFTLTASSLWWEIRAEMKRRGMV